MSGDVTLPVIIRARDAAAMGLSRGIWLGPEFTPVRRGVRAATGVDILDPDVRISAVAAQLPRHAAISGWAAARLHEQVHARDDLRVFDGSQVWDDGRRRGGTQPMGVARVLICAPRESRLALRPDVRIFRSEVTAPDRVRLAGLSIASPMRAAFDMARLLPVTQAVVALDRLAYIGAVTPEALAAYVRDCRAARGRTAAVRALALADERAESPQESVLRLAWIGAGLPRPRANRVVTALDGRFVARVDLIDSRAGVIGEYDGAVHWEARRRSRDAERQEALEELGLVVVRATSADVATEAAVSAWQKRLREAYRRADSGAGRPRRWRVR